MVLAPSNAAVANVARRLISEKDQFCLRNVVVWGDNCDKTVRKLNPRLRYSDYTRFCRRSDATTDEDKEEELKSILTEDSHGLSIGEMEVLCADSDGHASVASASVVLCTLNTAGSRSLQKAVKASKKKFELCVLDEASQCSEAEFYIATTFPNVKRMVVVGYVRKY